MAKVRMELAEEATAKELAAWGDNASKDVRSSKLSAAEMVQRGIFYEGKL
jgi:hypothetical protein